MGIWTNFRNAFERGWFVLYNILSWRVEETSNTWFIYVVAFSDRGSTFVCLLCFVAMTLQLKSAYAIAKLRKSGYSKQKFYKEAVDLYKEVHFCNFGSMLESKLMYHLLTFPLLIFSLKCIQINTLMANGGKGSLRKHTTEMMYSVWIHKLLYMM